MISLGQMREILEKHGIQLTKSLGQNFLHDHNQLRRILTAAEISATDRVLEIGPGLGPLTELLLQEAGQVLAIEKDARLIPLLRERFSERANLELVHADALEITRDHSRDWSEWKLVANLPYSVASPILVDLAQNSNRPRMLVATLQLEVARRLMAKPGEDDYGLLTLLVQLRYNARSLFKIPRGCFFPEPDVDSACIVLARRATPLLAEDRHAAFEKVARRALSQRRKMMAKLLRGDWPEDRIRQAIEATGLRPDIRGEKLSIEQFVTLTGHLLDTK